MRLSLNVGMGEESCFDIDHPCGQVKEWSPKIEGIVDWFGQLQEVDVEGVPPALRAEVENENFLRKDLPRQYEQR